MTVAAGGGFRDRHAGLIRRLDLPHLVLATLMTLLCITVAGQLILSVAAILEPRELMYGEAMVHEHAGRLLRGEPLYQRLDQPPYTVAAYTPVYYVLAAGLQAIFGPGFGPGRALSLAAAIAAAILVGYLAVQRARLFWIAPFAALLFLALGLPWFHLWSALYRVDVLGVALSIGAITTLTGGTTRRRLVAAGLLAGLAALTKQTFVAAGLAGMIWLWRLDKGRASVFGGSYLLIVLSTLTALEIATGAFLQNALLGNVNPLSAMAATQNFAIFIMFQGGVIITALLYVIDRQLKVENQEAILWIYFALTTLPIIGLGKVGSTQNYWIEFAAASAVLAASGVANRLVRYYKSGCQSRTLVPMIMLGVPVFVLSITLIISGPASFDELQTDAVAAGEFGDLLERVGSEPGQVLADPLDVLVLANRRILLEPYIYNILLSQRRWKADSLVSQLCEGQIGLLVVSHSIEGDQPRHHGYTRWPARVLQALRQTMIFEREQAGRFIYIPRSPMPADCGTQAS